MVQIFLCWVYIFLSSFLIGNGTCTLLARLLKYEPGPLHPVIVSFVGFLPLMVGLGFYSVFYPVGPGAHLILAAGIVLLLIRTRKKPVNVNMAIPALSLPLLLALSVVVFLLLFKSAQGITTPDSAGYHLPFIKWIENYRVLPGLANVHSRFGFNYQYHLLSAFYGCSFLSGDTIHALNGYIQCATLVYLLSSLRFSAGGAPLYRSDIAKCLVAFVVLNMSNAASSFSPDFPVTAIVIAIFFLLFEKAESKTMYRWDMGAAVICLLCVIAVLFKISAAPVFLCCLFFLWLCLRQGSLKRVVLLCIFIGFCFLPYIIRNYFISGYLVYPLYSLDLLHPEWKLPLQKVIYEKEVIRTYALGLPYGVDTGFRDSMISWYHYLKATNSVYVAIIMALSLCLLLNILLLAKLAIRKTEELRYWLPVFIVLYAALLYWFFNAPDPRFGNGYILPFIAINIAWYLQPLFRIGVMRRLILPGTCLLVLLLSVSQMAGKSASRVSLNFKQSRKWNWIRQDVYPRPDTITIRENDRLSYRVPSTGFCWQAPQPCCYCSDSFRYRGALIQQGFLPWQSK